jgi:hypothetical protein
MPRIGVIPLPPANAQYVRHLGVGRQEEAPGRRQHFQPVTDAQSTAEMP